MAFIPTRNDAILFCIRSDIENLKIINRNDLISVNNSEINSIINDSKIYIFIIYSSTL